MGDDDDRAIFEDALESMTPGDVFRGKYGVAPDPTDDDDARPEPREESIPREEIQRLRELREMEDAFRGIEPIDRGKVRAAPPKDHLTTAEVDDLRAEFEAALAPPEPAPVAAKTRRLLAEQVGDDVHTLNLRAMDPDRAIVQLGLFVDLASKDRREFIRIRVGTNEVLLQAVQDWFKGPGIAYVDEVEIAQARGDAAVFARICHTVGS